MELAILLLVFTAGIAFGAWLFGGAMEQAGFLAGYRVAVEENADSNGRGRPLDRERP